MYLRYNLHKTSKKEIETYHFFYRNICYQFSLFREVRCLLHFDYLEAKNKTF